MPKWLFVIISVTLLCFIAIVSDITLFDGYFINMSLSRATLLLVEEQQMAKATVTMITDEHMTLNAEQRQAVFEALERFKMVGIELIVEDWRSQKIPDIVAPSDLVSWGKQQEHVSDIILVLSQQNFHIKNAKHVDVDLAGIALPFAGVVLVDASSIFKPEYLASTVQHELAHLYYVSHEDNTIDTAMSSEVSESQIWSADAQITLERLRFRPWW